MPVRNLQVSTAFFADLGFTFSAELSGGDTACMVVDQNICVMLVAEDRFWNSVDGDICQTTANASFVTSLSAASEQEVDDMVAKAIAAGGKPSPSWRSVRSAAAASKISMATFGSSRAEGNRGNELTPSFLAGG